MIEVVVEEMSHTGKIKVEKKNLFFSYILALNLITWSMTHLWILSYMDLDITLDIPWYVLGILWIFHGPYWLLHGYSMDRLYVTRYCGYSINLTWYILYYSRHSFEGNLLQSHMWCCGVVKSY